MVSLTSKAAARSKFELAIVRPSNSTFAASLPTLLGPPQSRRSRSQGNILARTSLNPILPLHHSYQLADFHLGSLRKLPLLSPGTSLGLLSHQLAAGPKELLHTTLSSHNRNLCSLPVNLSRAHTRPPFLLRRTATTLPLLALLLPPSSSAQSLPIRNFRSQQPLLYPPSSPPPHPYLHRPHRPAGSRSRVALRASWHPLSGGDEAQWAKVELQEMGLMTWTHHHLNDQDALVAHLGQHGAIKHDAVQRTMQTVDRGLFVPDGMRSAAYADSPQPIGFNATISAPHMHAHCLELLLPYLTPGARALDVGSGTGYLTACMALLVGEGGRVVGVEHIPELAESSVSNIRSCAPVRPMLESGALEIHAGDGRKGWRQHAPYAAIHVGAAAPEIPRDLLLQLAVGGRMVIPVGSSFQDLRVVDKLQDGTLREFSAADVRYVPLTDRDLQIRGA